MGLPVETLENGQPSAGVDEAAESSALGGFKIDISHQEVERIVDELEEIYRNQPQEWLNVEAIAMLLCTMLGYEDMDEFEDAIKGGFAEFLEQLPHVELKSRETDNMLQLKVKPPPPPEEWRHKTLTFHITQLSDLHRVCLKAAEATIEIPELEFEISPDRKSRIDTIYNHVGSAIFNLGSHVRMNPGMETDTANKIIDTVIALNILLDVEKPWTFVVKDPTGFSDIKPLDGIEIHWDEA